MKNGRITIGRIENGEYILGEKPDPNQEIVINLFNQATNSLDSFLKLKEEAANKIGSFMPSEIAKKGD